MRDFDDRPSFKELLLCIFVCFALFVTKQEIFEKGESNYFFKKYVIYSDRKYVHYCGSQFSKASILRGFCVKRKPQKAFLSSGNFSHHFSKPSRRNDLLKF